MRILRPRVNGVVSFRTKKSTTAKSARRRSNVAQESIIQEAFERKRSCSSTVAVRTADASTTTTYAPTPKAGAEKPDLKYPVMRCKAMTTSELHNARMSDGHRSLLTKFMFILCQDMNPDAVCVALVSVGMLHLTTDMQWIEAVKNVIMTVYESNNPDIKIVPKV